MTHDRPPAVEDFLAVRHQLARAENTPKLEVWDDQLRDMCSTDPNRAAAIIDALSVSDDLGAKNAAALFVRYLYPVQSERARRLLLTLRNDPDTDIRSKARDSIDKITSNPDIDPTQAAQLSAELASRPH